MYIVFEIKLAKRLLKLYLLYSQIFYVTFFFSPFLMKMQNPKNALFRDHLKCAFQNVIWFTSEKALNRPAFDG